MRPVQFFALEDQISTILNDNHSLNLHVVPHRQVPVEGYQQPPLVAEAPDPEELGFEQTLRPQTLAEYVGQEKVVNKLAVFMEAARAPGTFRPAAAPPVLR